MSHFSHTFDGPGHKVWRGLSLLDPVALHDLPLLGEAEEPGPARLLLPVHSGRVDHIVVLKNGLLELALRREHLLQKEGRRWSTCMRAATLRNAHATYESMHANTQKSIFKSTQKSQTHADITSNSDGFNGESSEREKKKAVSVSLCQYWLSSLSCVYCQGQ